MKNSTNVLSKTENFAIRFYLFKNALKPEKLAVFSGKKVKSLHKYCPVATGKTFSPKFILAAKVQK